MDARARDGQWTARILGAVADKPQTRAADLAQAISMGKASFKRRVRSLKELGLTESLEVGYRLSPRGVRIFERENR
jgi:DNA-binding IclR family transcriptional regulator